MRHKTLEQQANEDVERAIKNTAFLTDVLDSIFRPTETMKWLESVGPTLAKFKEEEKGEGNG